MSGCSRAPQPVSEIPPSLSPPWLACQKKKKKNQQIADNHSAEWGGSWWAADLFLPSPCLPVTSSRSWAVPGCPCPPKPSGVTSLLAAPCHMHLCSGATQEPLLCVNLLLFVSSLDSCSCPCQGGAGTQIFSSAPSALPSSETCPGRSCCPTSPCKTPSDEGEKQSAIKERVWPG